MSTFRMEPPGGDTVAGLVRSAWRYKGLIVAPVLLGALLGYGWTARQPRRYEGAAQVAQDANVVTIRVVDSTAKGTAQLANAVTAASEQIIPSLMPIRVAVPGQAIQSRPGRAMAIGMLLGLLTCAVLVWWRTRRQGPTPRSSAPEQGPEMPSPA